MKANTEPERCNWIWVERPTWPFWAATCRRASAPPLCEADGGAGARERWRASRPPQRAGGPFHPDLNRIGLALWRGIGTCALAAFVLMSNAAGAQRTYTMVSVGDSVASGEGNPDVPQAVELNPLFNPIRLAPNPAYDPVPQIPNTNYNPVERVINPDYNPVQRIINPNYQPYPIPQVLRPLLPNFPPYNPNLTIPNPDYDPNLTKPNPDYDPNLTVANPDFTLVPVDGENWVVRLEESTVIQGDQEGTAHPNGKGQAVYRDRLVEEIEQAGIESLLRCPRILSISILNSTIRLLVNSDYPPALMEIQSASSLDQTIWDTASATLRILGDQTIEAELDHPDAGITFFRVLARQVPDVFGPQR